MHGRVLCFEKEESCFSPTKARVAILEFETNSNYLSEVIMLECRQVGAQFDITKQMFEKE
jgi:hypothetical protein